MAAAWSLKGRLVLLAAASCLVAWLAGGAAVYLAAQREAALLFDARLQDLATTLQALSAHELAEIAMGKYETPEVLETEATRQERYRYQIWSTDGRLLMSSTNASAPLPLMPRGQGGFVTRSIDGAPFRVVSTPGLGGHYEIQAAEPIAERGALGDIFSAYLLAGLGISALLLGGLSLLLVRLALRPVHRAGSELERRGPLDLREVAQEPMPAEFEPVFAAINRLMKRIEVAMQSERNFVSAAAHELRTPLAGLRAQAQLAAHPRADAVERSAALRSVLDGADQATHLVNQLLDLARSDMLAGDPSRLAEDSAPVALEPLFEATLAELGPAAAQRRVNTRFEVDRIDGSAFGIGLILRNLLANALAHVPENGAVVVGSRRDGATVVLGVEDSGPGLAATDQEHVFERFRRGTGIQRPGAGLGLSIVKAIADAHGARIALERSALGGLAVQVAFPTRQG